MSWTTIALIYLGFLAVFLVVFYALGTAAKVGDRQLGIKDED